MSEYPMRNRKLAITLLASVSALACLAVSAGTAQDAGAVTQVTGVFDDGQEWQISVPADWNGVVVNDLDSVGDVEDAGMRSSYFLGHGYAYTGTRRHPDRNTNWDPQAESDNMVRVLDLFEEQFGEPTYAIQFGCSGGGSVGLSVAEDHPDRFDGVISMHASTPVELANMRLDLAIALKALLDPEGDSSKSRRCRIFAGNVLKLLGKFCRTDGIFQTAPEWWLTFGAVAVTFP